MKKLMKVALVLAAAAMVFTGCDKAADDGKMKFVVGFDADFPPYGFKDGAEYKGFDLDLAREVCARRGWTFVANPSNWDAKDMELNSGSISCIWNGFTMQGREEGYTRSEAYVDGSQVVLVKAGSPVKTLKDLAGRKVGVQTDTPVQKELAGKGDKKEVAALGKTLTLVVMPNYNQAVMDLDSGAVDAVALDVGVARQKMCDMPGKFEQLPEIVMTETYGIGFKKGNTALRDQVQATLKEMVRDGTVEKIAVAYKIEPKSIILKP